MRVDPDGTDAAIGDRRADGDTLAVVVERHRMTGRAAGTPVDIRAAPLPAVPVPAKHAGVPCPSSIVVIVVCANRQYQPK